jgi:hypothetical protein
MEPIQSEPALDGKAAGVVRPSTGEAAPEAPPQSLQETMYETGCGRCGAQFHFRQALTGWTTVYCYRCLEYVSVR